MKPKNLNHLDSYDGSLYRRNRAKTPEEEI